MARPKGSLSLKGAAARKLFRANPDHYLKQNRDVAAFELGGISVSTYDLIRKEWKEEQLKKEEQRSRPLFPPQVYIRPPARFTLGQFDADERKVRKAIAEYENYLTLHPDGPEHERVRRDLVKLRTLIATGHVWR